LLIEAQVLAYGEPLALDHTEIMQRNAAGKPFNPDRNAPV
jgi:hypothetical protein